MLWFKKKPKRLYMPAKGNWLLRSRRTPERRRAPTAWVLKWRHWFGKKRWLVGGVILLVLAGAVGVTASSLLSVRDIEVLRQDFSLDSAAVENRLARFRGRSLLLISEAEVEAAVRSDFPEFSGVRVEKIFPHTLRLNLESVGVVANLRAYYTLPLPEKEPVRFDALNRAIEELSGKKTETPTSANEPALPQTPFESPGASIAFSLEAPLSEAGIPVIPPEAAIPAPVEQKGLLNAVGQALFGPSENLELVTVVVRGLTQPVENRQRLIPPEEMTFLKGAVDYFSAALKHPVKEAEILLQSREIHLTAEKGLTVWLATDRDYREQIDKLAVVYEPAELNKESLSYIDLRVTGKVIYCPRHSPCDK